MIEKYLSDLGKILEKTAKEAMSSDNLESLRKGVEEVSREISDLGNSFAGKFVPPRSGQRPVPPAGSQPYKNTPPGAPPSGNAAPGTPPPPSSSAGDYARTAYARTAGSSPPPAGTRSYTGAPPPQPFGKPYYVPGKGRPPGPPVGVYPTRGTYPTGQHSTSLVINKRRKNSVGGILLTVFGSIGTALFGVSGLVASIGAAVTGILLASPIAIAAVATCTAFLAGSVAMLSKGVSLCARASRFRHYIKQLGNSTFCPVGQLAEAIGRKPRFVVRDLQKLIKAGYFPHAHLDEKGTCLMLDDETYRQYQQAQAKYQEKKRNAERQAPPEKIKPTGNAELDAAVAEGQNYIRRIKQANEGIPGEEFSMKLSRLEDVTTRIFAFVAKHPAKLPEIRKFMEYYLPTTLKLLYAYQQFDAQPTAGENIAAAKTEIEDTLDTINNAFENLLDNLFDEDIMDVSTDISVLETMLAQEGLTDSDFKKSKDAE